MNDKRRPYFVLLVAILLSGVVVGVVRAHANLIRSNPPANAVLDQSPDEIRLWFTEPLEPHFSTISLRDSEGAVVDTPRAEVDPDDDFQLFLLPGELTDGVYTVAWRVISSTDGHQTEGSFPFVIGDAVALAAQQTSIETPIPLDSAVIRWLNPFSMALAVGSVGFWLFVWNPSVSQTYPQIERRMRTLIWAGWAMLGATTVLILLLQTSIVADTSVLAALTDSALKTVITDTRFGEIWIIRVVLWLFLGVTVFAGRKNPSAYWAALITGVGILLTQSLFSHASSVPETVEAVAGDWLHMTAMALWIGGLAQFANVIRPIQRAESNPASTVGRLVGYFSNYMRMGVAILVVTGVYSAWLHIGSLEAAFNTTYGRAFLVKLALILPLLGIAGVNLVFTARALNAGKSLWASRLRKLILAEIVLTVSILGAVGVMTAIAPARTTQAERDAVPPQIEPAVYTQTQTIDGINVALEISPAWVGESAFTVRLNDGSGAPINDASLIRMRFDQQTESLGESELRPTFQDEGAYSVSGANLSVPGEWRIRITVQRPNEYDTLVDFTPQISLPPLPPPIPDVDPTPSLPARLDALLVTGLVGLAISALFLSRIRLRLLTGQGALAIFMLIVSGVLVVGGVENRDSALDSAPLNITLAPDAPMRAVITRGMNLPLLVTGDGKLLQPDDNNVWKPSDLDVTVNDVYISGNGDIWAATDAGLFTHSGDQWIQVDDLASNRLSVTHGYVFSLGIGEVSRIAEGGVHDTEPRLLDVPETDQPADQMVMLGNHTHILQNGSDVFQSESLGLGWKTIEAPVEIQSIGNDVNGYLLADTDSGVMIWNWMNQTWRTAWSRPDDQPLDETTIFQDKLYVTAGGRLYLQKGAGWERIKLPDSSGAYLTALTVYFPDAIWVLDSARNRLYTSDDGESWTVTQINIEQ